MIAEDNPWSPRFLAVHLVALVLGIGPFFNGMFYEPVRLVGVILACTALLLWQGDRNSDKHFTVTVLDLSVVGWFVSYLLATVTMVFPRGHLSSLLDLAAVLAVYLVARRQREMETSITGILVGFTAVMSLISLVSWLGWPVFDRFFFQLHVDGRVSGGFQYPNTFAAWLFVMVLLLRPEIGPSVRGYAARAFSGLLATVFVMTLSRGALLAVVPTLAFQFVITPGPQRVQWSVFSVMTWIPSLVLGTLAVGSWREGQTGVTLLLVVVSAVPPVVSALIEGGIRAAAARLSKRQIIVGATLLVVGLLATAPVLWSRYNPLPALTEARQVERFAFNEPNVVLRMAYKADALQIMADRKYIGAGGQGWSRLYRQYQDFFYSSTEVHDHFLQTGVEAGVVGLFFFVGLFVTALLVGIRHLRKEPCDTYTAPWLAAVVFLGIHSFMDFDLSYTSMLMLLGLLLGLIGSRTRHTVRPMGFLRPHAGRFAALAVTAVCGAAIFVSLSLAASRIAIRLGNQEWAKGNYSTAEARFQLAAVLDPIGPAPAERKASLWGFPGTDKSGADRLQAWEETRRRDPHFVVNSIHLSTALVDVGRLEDGADMIEKALRLAPVDRGVNEAVVNVYWRAVSTALEQSNLSLARMLASRISRFREEFDEKLKRAERYQGLWENPVRYSPTLYLRTGQLLVAMGDPEEGIAPLKLAAQDQAFTSEALQWLYLAYELTGRATDAAAVKKDRTAEIGAFTQSLAYRQLRETP